MGKEVFEKINKELEAEFRKFFKEKLDQLKKEDVKDYCEWYWVHWVDFTDIADEIAENVWEDLNG